MIDDLAGTALASAAFAMIDFGVRRGLARDQLLRAARAKASGGGRHQIDAMTNLRDARAAYYEANHFGADGGDALRWVPLRVLGLTLYIPNTDGRRRAVRVHDLHHVLTGYPTDLGGEAEIAAWELATGCRRVPAALVLNLGALAIGMLMRPRRMLAAWARGRRTRNLYATPYGDALLARAVDDVRTELGLDRAAEPARAGHVLGLALTAAVALTLLALPVIGVVAAIAALR